MSGAVRRLLLRRGVDPRRAIRSQTRELKRSRDAMGAALLTEVAEWTSTTLLSAGARAVTTLRPFNLVVTNVPGPQIPLYLLGARLRAAYPVAPLLDRQRLAVALLSVDDQLRWGFNADYDSMEDLALWVEDLRESVEALQALAARRPRASRSGVTGSSRRSPSRAPAPPAPPPASS